MKIKYLKIRNIASIESGDIDFENGLIDHETGMPSSLFLITGDTGSGKSVILDCISMCLYGTTPRVRSVNDSRNNVYKNNDGEEISVNNIRQYTRIGISWKDDCYSELAFTGNDGVEYLSRFSLGRTSHRNYRDPAWRLTVGGTMMIEKRDDIKERIQKAVGLTFEQFSRMAMLAQGQFATFLTGKKEERERILEQLTATDIFSRYGEAIYNIFKRTKQAKEISSKIFEEFRKNILNDETLLELQKEQDEKNILASNLRAETDKLRQRISHTEAVMKAEKDISALKADNAELKALEDSPDFLKRSALIDLWDKTESQRGLLANKLETIKKIDTDMRILQEMKYEFIILSEDLSIRREAAKERVKTLDEERNWLQTRESLLPIFTESAVTILKIKNYLALLKESELKVKEATDGKAVIETILKEIGEHEKSVKDKELSCAACQLEINKKSEERDSLDPSKLRKENESLINRKHSLKDLSAQLKKAETERADIEKDEKDLREKAKLLAELNEASDKAVYACKKAEKDLKDSEERYMTMHLSVSKNFRELRRKLSEEHASICPLCGQSISDHLKEWSNDKYFSKLLSPLEEEKKKLTEIFAFAKKEADEAVKVMNTTTGGLKTKEIELNKRKKNLVDTESAIKDRIKALEMTESENLPDIIENELAKIESEIVCISERLTLAEKIQKEIDALIKQKESLDRQHRDADSLLQKSVRNLTKKKEGVKNAELRVEELRLEIQNLRDSITLTLKGYADDWQSDPSANAERLKNDSDTYAEKSSSYAKEMQSLTTLLNALDSITAIQENLSEKLEAVDNEAEGALSFSVKSLKIETLQKKWNDFLIEVSTVISRKTDNESKVKDIEKELYEYYIATGITETTLRQLLGAAREVNEARNIQQKHREDMSKNNAILAEAIKSKEENLRALNIEDISHIEDLEQLKSALTLNDKRQGELTQQLGVIKEKLEADAKIREDSELKRKELELTTLRYEKWEKMNRYFGGTRFRTLVQSHILRPLLNNANIYLHQITDHYTLTCSDDNEQLSILVLDRYNNEPRSVTVLSGGERFMISLALSLALSAMNRPDLNVDILFIDEGFGTLDAKSLEMVMSTLRRLPEINGQTGRRVGVISHREELTEQIPTQIQLRRIGEGRSKIEIRTS